MSKSHPFDTPQHNPPPPRPRASSQGDAHVDFRHLAPIRLTDFLGLFFLLWLFVSDDPTAPTRLIGEAFKVTAEALAMLPSEPAQDVLTQGGTTALTATWNNLASINGALHAWLEGHNWTDDLVGPHDDGDLPPVFEAMLDGAARGIDRVATSLHKELERAYYEQNEEILKWWAQHQDNDYYEPSWSMKPRSFR